MDFYKKLTVRFTLRDNAAVQLGWARYESLASEAFLKDNKHRSNFPSQRNFNSIGLDLETTGFQNSALSELH